MNTKLILNKSQWTILIILQDDVEPFEIVDGAVEKIDPKSTPFDTLNDLYFLWTMGFIGIAQVNISVFGQKFAEKEIVPSSPAEILGDLEEYFNDYLKT